MMQEVSEKTKKSLSEKNEVEKLNKLKRQIGLTTLI